MRYVRLSVRPSIVIMVTSERKELRTSHFANRLLLAIGRLVLKMGYIGPHDLAAPKPVDWGLGLMERPIRTKFNIYTYIPTLNNTTKNYSFTGSGTSHISIIGILGSWAHVMSDSHQI